MRFLVCYNNDMKNFVFDLYGTLIDVRTDENAPEFRAKVAARFNKLCGKEVDFWSEYDRASGLIAPDEEIDFIAEVKKIAKRGGVELSDRKAKNFARRFRKDSTLKMGVYKGVHETLKSLRKVGAKIYLLSNAQSSFTLREIKKCRLFGYFDGIELSSDFGKKKPSREFFYRLKEKYSLDFSETVYTGNDCACDIIPSKALGMRAVYVHTDISPAEDCLSDVSAIADFSSDGDFERAGEFLLKCAEEK